jgi:hypothetical protein
MGLDVLPSLMTLPPSTFLRVTPPPSPDVTLEKKGALTNLARLLGRLRPVTPWKPSDLAWRNPMVRDYARDRDATSFGLVNRPKLSALGAAVAGVAAGANVGPVLAKISGNVPVSAKMPVALSPTLFQGGGGIALRARW